jgi:hypothetical protein
LLVKSHFVPALLLNAFAAHRTWVRFIFVSAPSRHEIRRADQLEQVDYVLVVDH